jgi:23S rRNA (cytosine1962-C5)-methyltransferase
LNSNNAQIASVRRHAVQADAFKWIDEARETYDLIITDPPTLAKRESERAGAIRAYQHLNAAAISRLRPGGILVAASCSAHVSAEDFLRAIEVTAQASARTWKELWRTGHALDHPAIFREAEYLKAVCIELGM